MRVEVKGKEENLIFDTGTVARQADGSVLVYQGDTVVLVTAGVSSKPREGVDFLPLTVEYQEMAYAAGHIPGGFIKREGRPGAAEILVARCIDRPIRPLFPEGFRNELQVIAKVLSADPEYTPDVMAINGVSAALHLSSIPFDGPIGATRVGRIDGEFVVDPSFEALENSEMDLLVVGTKDAIVMVEGEAKEISEEIVLDAITFAGERIKTVIATIEELRDLAGKQKMTVVVPQADTKIYNDVCDAGIKGYESIIEGAHSKQDRHALMGDLRSGILDGYDDETKGSAGKAFEQFEKDALRSFMRKEKKRIDGRGFDDIRPIDCKAGLLPRAHGSALFTRGETQALAVVTLGSPRDEQRVENLNGESSKAFMLDYIFPPFCVGEVKMLRGPSRREMGHGHLAERSLKQVLPDDETFPYTIRIVSEILESNGSSSMASVCGGSLALMDAGVPIKKPVAGIAMGLIKEADDYLILTDILGDEDHLGDMDFKVTGTADGITAMQMDIKISGLPKEVMKDAMDKAKDARLRLLDIMNKAIDSPRAEVSPYAPKSYSLMIKAEKIRTIIGPGGKMIKEITAKTDTKIEIDDSGRIDIFSPDDEHAQMAIDIIKGLTEEMEVGRIYSGKVAKIMDFGAFVDFPSGGSGLVHISQLANERVKSVRDVVSEGDEVRVKVIAVDERTGKIRLSLKDALEGAEE